jgi:hypothetical protein
MLSESDLDRSSIEKSLLFAGGSIRGRLIDRHNAVRKEVCCTLSDETKQDTKTISYLCRQRLKKNKYFADKYNTSKGLV